MIIRFLQLFGVLLLLVLLNACSAKRAFIEPAEKISKPKPVTAPQQARPVKKKTVTKKRKPPVVVQKPTINDELDLLLGQQNYLAALATAHQGVENGHSEKALSSEYLRALLGVLRQAEESMRKGALDEAGNNFQAALSHFPRGEKLASLAPMTAEQIKNKIDICANRLMEDGLLAYRAGKLSTAIGIWEKILTFLPHHQASQKAIHTASLQLTNLKTLVKQQ